MTDEPAEVWFSLDGGDNITMNTLDNQSFSYTLTLSEGTHEVIFYANDTFGNEASVSVTFSVELPEEEEEEDEEKKGKIRDVYEEDPDEDEYLSQFEYVPPVIDLTEAEPSDEKASFFQEIWQSIIDFFKRLFGFK